ncbi:hypothetical protein [Synechocystis sp. LKSZ1]|uniref:hypothetical protein n=1 Tax=Synechocystis sp. LKSZ1 TaxID=3144951 RepID=UPI00336C1836
MLLIPTVASVAQAFPALNPTLALEPSTPMSRDESTQAILTPALSAPAVVGSPSLEAGELPANEDPLNSPYPIPWHWITTTQQEYADKGQSGLRYYRSPALVSPDGKYAAYSRIELRAEPELYRSKVVSVMFLEDLATGALQVIRADSPIAHYLQQVGEDSEEVEGVISILLPASWSAQGDHLLARQVEGALSTSDILDYGVVWSQETRTAKTLQALTPSLSLASISSQGGLLEDGAEMSTTLLGWNQSAPGQVLFQTNTLGEEDAAVVSVALNGQSYLSASNTVATYGQVISRSWSGVQSIR